MAKTFADMLRELLKKRKLTGRAFDRQVSTGQGFVNQILRGEAAPPLHQLESWADELELRDGDRERFLTLGRSAKARQKADVRDYVEGLEDRIASLEALIASLAAKVEKLEVDDDA